MFPEANSKDTGGANSSGINCEDHPETKHAQDVQIPRDKDEDLLLAETLEANEADPQPNVVKKHQAPTYETQCGADY